MNNTCRLLTFLLVMLDVFPQYCSLTLFRGLRKEGHCYEVYM